MPNKLFPLTLIIGLLIPFSMKGQYTWLPGDASEVISLEQYAEYTVAGPQAVSLSEFLNQLPHTPFKPVPVSNPNLGFVNGQVWMRFKLENKSGKPVSYFLETGRPITDQVTLHLQASSGNWSVAHTGDNLPFKERSFSHRKSLFPIHLEPGESMQGYLSLYSDGEVLNIPLKLQSAESLIRSTYHEQLLFGFFYGILVLAAITYFFFYFAMREGSFLAYSLYVVFVGLMQFSLDGHFYQYLTPGGGWLSLRAVLIFATLSTLFFGIYNQVFLQVRKHSKHIYAGFVATYVLVVLSLLGIGVAPQVLAMSYPLANVLGLVMLALALVSLVFMKIKRLSVDGFFAVGILCLVAGFVVFILNNFGLIPNSFLTENSTKFGTGLEVIFLSLSMANRIAILKQEKEKMQAVALLRSEEMNEIKSFFLSNMSHELRTPLNAILGLAEAMAKDPANQKMQDQCEVIKHASHSLLASVNDILDFSRIEKNELTLDRENFDPAEVLQQISSHAEKLAHEKGLDFYCNLAPDLPKMVTGDPARLSQIVNNVLGNAVKFTQEGLVKMEVFALRMSEDSAKLSLVISDTGIGISQDKMDRMFEVFNQSNITDKRAFGGFGLGLSIVKKLVELHQGTIEIESALNQGTVCRIELDYGIPSLPAPASTPAPVLFAYPTDEYDLKGKHILIIEDNEINQLVMKSMLKKWKNTTFSFANEGEEGVNALREEPVDLILMDLQMPIMDGFEATQAIRAGAAGFDKRDIPIIAVTADTMDATRQRVFESGMDDYMTKPIDKDKLYLSIIRLLSERAARKPSGR